MAAIETENLTKRYDGEMAVDDLSITVEEGEAFGLLGPDGSGKSTTIEMLLDIVRPTTGRAEVFGFDCQKESKEVHRRVGYVPEEYELYGTKSGMDHLEFAQKTRGSDEDLEEVWERVGLDLADADHAAGGYSESMRQRLVLAMALVGSPDLLLLDEPTGVLDEDGKRLVQRIVSREVEEGATVVFASSVLSEIEESCGRVALLDDGQTVAVDRMDALRTNVGVVSVMRLVLDELPDGAADELIRLGDVVGFEKLDDGVEVRCGHPSGKAEAINALEDMGATVLDIRIREPSLDNVSDRLSGGSP